MPEHDIVCRFVRPDDWSSRDKRPRPGAFKQPSLSVWHVDRLNQQRVAVEELQIRHLVGSGQAHHEAADYLESARLATAGAEIALVVQVEWRPGPEYVEEDWRPWSYGHVQVEAIEGPPAFTPEFRRWLALHPRAKVPPDEYQDQDTALG